MPAFQHVWFFDVRTLPFDVLARELRPDRSQASEPFYRVVFALQNAGRGTITLPGTACAQQRGDTAGAGQGHDAQARLVRPPGQQ